MNSLAHAMNALSSKRLVTGAVIFSATLLFLAATSDSTPRAITILANAGNNDDAIVATGTHMQMTEYADNGRRLYSLEVAEWTQYQGAESTHIDLMLPEMRLFDDSDTTPWLASAQQGQATKLGDLPRLTLSDEVLLRRASPSTQALSLRSDRLAVDAANESITAQGNVILTFGSLRTRAPLMVLHKNSTLEFNREDDMRVISTLRLPIDMATESSVANDA